MAIPKITGAQRDFSAGELDVDMKRADDNPVQKTGARQMLNWRILNAHTVRNRPGRTALFKEFGRIEKVQMKPGQFFYLVFGNGYISVYNAAGTRVYTNTVLGGGLLPVPWTTATLGGITYAISGLSIYIFYPDAAPNNVPQILSWDGNTQTSTWQLVPYAETITVGAQKRTFFYRITAPNVTLLPSATGGNINITFSAPVLISATMIGTRLRYAARQLTITGISTQTIGTAFVDEALPPGQILTLSSSVGVFNVGDEVRGGTSGAVGIVTVVAATITVQLLQSASTLVVAFTAETIAGPSASAVVSGVATTTPQAISVWDDEVMNFYRGYPSSVFFDQSRLGVCNFPSVPAAIGWSAIGLPTDLYVGALPTSAIFEIVPGNPQVLFVVAGMESSEFVFCDNAILYIPITPANPLVPGNVSFNALTAHGCMPKVQPRRAEQAIVYMKSGGGAVGAIMAPGAYARPYVTEAMSELHSHLFTASPAIAIAIPSAATQFDELYIYIALANGNIVTGRYAMKQGLIEPGTDGKPKIGWAPWNGGGTVSWIAALFDAVIFSSSYVLPGLAAAGIPAIGMVEQLDNAQYLDSAIVVNSVPAAFAPPVGMGRLFAIANGQVTLMDGLRMMGTYQVDAFGNIVPQGNAGENLLSATLVAGQPWTATLEPFVPDAQTGQDFGQRMKKRRVSRVAVYVSQSTGFLLARLFSGKLRRNGPALGTIMNTHRVATWNQDDDPTQQPPLREDTERWRPVGRSFDPRISVIKDTPGPLEIHEIGFEVSI